MRIVVFCHSLLSDWNHGNAHFLRGIATELLSRSHDVRIYEAENAWSLLNLIEEQGLAPIQQFHHRYPGLTSMRYNLQTLDLNWALDGAHLVLVHEWNDHALVPAHWAAPGTRWWLPAAVPRYPPPLHYRSQEHGRIRLDTLRWGPGIWPGDSRPILSARLDLTVLDLA